MERVEVGRYGEESADGWAGWIGTKTWIIFVDDKGMLHPFGRNPETGAVTDEAPVINNSIYNS